MSKHTKGPWVLEYGLNGKAQDEGITFSCLGKNSAENAARIVACVNALEGVEDPEGWIFRSKHPKDDLENKALAWLDKNKYSLINFLGGRDGPFSDDMRNLIEILHSKEKQDKSNDKK